MLVIYSVILKWCTVTHTANTICCIYRLAVFMFFVNMSVFMQAIRWSNLFHYYQILTQNGRYFRYNLRPPHPQRTGTRCVQLLTSTSRFLQSTSQYFYPVFIITMYKEFHSFSTVRYFTGYYYAQYFDTRQLIWFGLYFFDDWSAKPVHVTGNGGLTFR